MKVSIIIPVYNVEGYIEECLNSAINQTLDDIEIICINDGSTDSSLDILKKYEKKYNNITVINQANKGLSASRNVGIMESKGEYIYFLDSDDYIDLNTIKICYEFSQNHNLDILTFDANCFYDKDYNGNEVNENYYRNHLLPEYTITGKEFYITSNKSNAYKAPVWLNFYRNKFIKDNKLLFVEGILHEDEIHTSQSLLLAKRVRYINYRLFNRRIRKDSIMTSGLNIKHIEGNFEVVKCLYKLYLENKDGDNKNLCDTLKRNINLHIRSTLYRCDSLKETDIKKELLMFIRDNKSIIEDRIDIQANSPSLFYSNIVNIDRSIEIKQYKNVKKIFYMLIPAHGNLGDQAIAYASIKFLEDKYPNHKIIKFNYNETKLYINIIKEVASNNDIIFLHGGGNMGNHYIWEEETRRYIISNLNDIPIVSFTQTIYFSDDYEGNKELEISKKIYNNHKNLIILAREEKSYQIMKKNFYNCNVYLCPDIVFYLNDKLNYDEKNINRRQIMACLRKDKESYYSINEKDKLIIDLRTKFELLEKDTIVNYRVNHINRKEELMDLWKEFYKSKIVITDRLHGMIFAAITKTPCIVLRSLDYKVTESYKWIEDLNYIKLTSDLSINNIEKLVFELEGLNEVDEFNFDKLHFENIKYVIDSSFQNPKAKINKRNTNKIEVSDIVINKNSIEYYLKIDDRLKKYFNYPCMKIDYSEEIIDMPDSISVIPVLANILPIAWFTDSDIFVRELDDVFYKSIENIKKAYEKMYNITLGGRVIVENLISNKYEIENKSITLFSGGVDSLSTAINNIDKNLILATIWGADVDCDNEEGWVNIKNAVSEIGEKFKLKNLFIKSDFRKTINERELDILCRQTIGCKFWWESIQHGIALISHLAPYAYKNKLGTIYIPGTLCEDYIKRYKKTKLASDPTIDNEFKFSSCTTIHEGFEYSRQQKIENISNYRNKVDYNFDTRVCFSSPDGKNCSKCRKCSITILGLIQQKQDPNKFGFNVDSMLLNQMKNKYENEFVFAPFALDWWDDIKKRFLEEKEIWIYNPSINWIMNIDTSEEFNTKKSLK